MTNDVQLNSVLLNGKIFVSGVTSHNGICKRTLFVHGNCVIIYRYKFQIFLSSYIAECLLKYREFIETVETILGEEYYLYDAEIVNFQYSASIPFNRKNLFENFILPLNKISEIQSVGIYEEDPSIIVNIKHYTLLQNTQYISFLLKTKDGITIKVQPNKIEQNNSSVTVIGRNFCDEINDRLVKLLCVSMENEFEQLLLESAAYDEMEDCGKTRLPLPVNLRHIDIANKIAYELVKIKVASDRNADFLKHLDDNPVVIRDFIRDKMTQYIETRVMNGTCKWNSEAKKDVTTAEISFVRELFTQICEYMNCFITLEFTEIFQESKIKIGRNFASKIDVELKINGKNGLVENVTLSDPMEKLFGSEDDHVDMLLGDDTGLSHMNNVLDNTVKELETNLKRKGEEIDGGEIKKVKLQNDSAVPSCSREMEEKGRNKKGKTSSRVKKKGKNDETDEEYPARLKDEKNINSFKKFAEESKRPEEKNDIERAKKNLEVIKKNIEIMSNIMEKQSKWMNEMIEVSEGKGELHCYGTCSKHCTPKLKLKGPTGRPPKKEYEKK